jgi:CRP/FNR family transcriptional regulator, cyclic AMP receptor protein
LSALEAQRPHLNGSRVERLLELDHDLGAQLSADRRAAASRLLVTVYQLAPTADALARLQSASSGHVGLLVVDGVLARELVLGDTVSTELLGPGDVIRPLAAEHAAELLRVEARWSVLSDAAIALLDRRIALELCHFPELYLALIDRCGERISRLATTQAISQLTRVDRRLLAYCWHLAERWGRITPDGVHLPLRLSHRLLGQLVGARRPTVSSALGSLARSGELVRRHDSTWLLRGEPVELATGGSHHRVEPRLKLMVGRASVHGAVGSR